MSNEQNPPPPALRLKPRLRPAEGQGAGAAPDSTVPAIVPAAEAPPPQSPVSDAAADSAPKIRLRPKLSAGVAATPAEATDVAQPAPPPAPVAPPPPPLFVDPPPGLPTSSSKPPLPMPTVGGLKLKPKAPAGVSAETPAASPLFVTDTTPLPVVEPPSGVEPPVYAPTAPAPKPEKVKTPPPFPVVARPKGSVPPPIAIPHLSLKNEVLQPEPEMAAPASAAKRGVRVALLAVAVIVVLGGGGFFAWKHFAALPPAPPPASSAGTPKSAAPAPAATTAASPSTAPAPSNPSPTPSETLNKLAQVPGKAISKAQEALAARRASGQDRVDAAAVGEDVTTKPFGPPPAAPIKNPAPPPTQTTTAMTSIAPGLTASTQMEAAPEASQAFRSFVANARVSGVFQGNPSRAVINGKLTRVGETVDANLGVTFVGVEAERKSLVFKDKTGATIARRY